MTLSPDLTTVCTAIAAIPFSGRRRLVAVAGAPASGKSTLADDIADQLNKGGHRSQVVPMDGFHLDNTVLDQMGLRPRKGAPETFDVGGLIRMINALSQDDQIYFPQFDRSRDIAIAGAATVAPDVETVIVEGNYLLFAETPWSALAPLWDLRIFLTVPENVLRGRLIDRWLAHDHSQAAAEARADGNDMANARRVYANRLPCDIDVDFTAA